MRTEGLEGGKVVPVSPWAVTGTSRAPGVCSAEHGDREGARSEGWAGTVRGWVFLSA